MSLTIAEITGAQRAPVPMGPFYTVLRDITGDSSYPALGYALTARRLGFPDGMRVRGMSFHGFPGGVAGLVGGATFDPTNLKLQFLAAAGLPVLQVEEVVTVTSNVGRLSRVPGPIMAIQVLAGTTTGGFRQIPVGKTPVTRQVAVNMVTGQMTFLSTDVVTSVAVTYVPLGVGNFTQANLVVDEAVTLATAGVNLANRAAYIHYVWNNTASGANRLPQLIPVGESPSSNQVAVDIVNSTNTTITPNSAQDTNAALVTYFKYDATWLSNHSFTDQTDIAVTSNAIALNEVLDIATLWIPAFGQVIVGETSGGTTNLQSVIQGPRGSTATNVCTFNPLTGQLAFASGDAYATVEMPYVLLSAALSAGGSGEMPAGANLASSTIRCMFWAD